MISLCYASVKSPSRVLISFEPEANFDWLLNLTIWCPLIDLVKFSFEFSEALRILGIDLFDDLAEMRIKPLNAEQARQELSLHTSLLALKLCPCRDDLLSG